MIYRLFLGLIFLLSLNNVGAQSIPNVVVSIKPIHSIVSALMEGVSRPQLLIESSDSAHTFHLKPTIKCRSGHNNWRRFRNGSQKNSWKYQSWITSYRE